MKGEDITMKKELKNHVIQTCVHQSVSLEVSRLAERQGLDVSALVRTWIVDRLAQVKKSTGCESGCHREVAAAASR